MKTICAVLVFLGCAFGCLAQSNRVQVSTVEIPEGSNTVLTSVNFLEIKRFILTNGLSQTYCQMYNNNPYYGFAGFNAYLNPDSGQANMNCDRSKSDFKHLVIQSTLGPGPIEYWHVIWNGRQHRLTLSQPWSKAPSNVLTKQVEEWFRKMLDEIVKKTESNTASHGTALPRRP